MSTQQKMMSPLSTIRWVPASGLTNFMIPTAAQLIAGVNLSEAVVDGYTLNATDSDTDDSKSITDSANVDNPTYDNYEASLQFFRSKIGTTFAPYDNAFNLFKKRGAAGFLCHRLGLINTAAPVAAQVWSIFGVVSDHPRTLDSDSGGPTMLEVPFVPTGQFNPNYSLLT